MSTALHAKQILETKLTAIAGRPVEITIRGESAFTFFFDGVDVDAALRLAATVNGEAVEIDADDELGTCIYVN